MEHITLLTQWGFLGLAVILLLLELFLQRGWLLLWAMSAAIPGFFHYLFPSGFDLHEQALFFVILGIVFSLNRWHSRRHAHLDDIKPKDLIGTTFTLTRHIRHGRSKIKLQRGIWYLECEEDLPKKTRVKVTHTSGVVLIVEADREIKNQ